MIAREMGGEIAGCRLSEWEVLVEVHVPVPLALPGTLRAVGRARAGPAESEPPPAPAARNISQPHRRRAASDGSSNPFGQSAQPTNLRSPLPIPTAGVGQSHRISTDVGYRGWRADGWPPRWSLG